MVKKRIFIGMSSILITSSILGTVVLGEPIKPTNSKSTQGTNAVTQPTALRIDNKVLSMTGTVVSRPTNDGIAYMLNTSEGTFALIGPSAKSLSSFANIDKKITVSGNPVIGQKIIVIQTFKEYVPEVKLSLSEDKNLKPTVSSDKNTTTQPTALRVDNKLISITGSITSKPTNDGIAYILNTSEGTFALIGPNAKSLSSFANSDKKITVSGNLVVGQKIIVVQNFNR